MRGPLPVVTAVLLAACAIGGTDRSYVPALDRRAAAASPAAPGTLQGDFQSAAASRSLSEAATRWERFLHEHEPADGEYEDAYQKYRIDAAKLELMRVYYLLGRRADGDRLLRTLDPLMLEQQAE
jgi:hypothetical protein